MNDFTKEELQMILDDIDNRDFLYSLGTPEQYQKMREKTMKMIESYTDCDHQWAIYTLSDGLKKGARCNKCHKGLFT